MRRFALVGVLAAVALFAVALAGASTPGADVRLTMTAIPMSVRRVLRRPRPVASATSAPTRSRRAIAYTDQTLNECTVSSGRQNEPAVAIDPRNTSVLLGSSNDYCGVYNRGDARGRGRADLARLLPLDRSAARASQARSSRGIPDDTSPYAALSQARTASCRRPGDRLGQPRPRVLRLGELGRSGGHRRRRSATSWSPASRIRTARRGATRLRTASSYHGTTVVARRLVGAEPARQVQRQDGDRGRPHRRRVRRQRLLLVVALHRQRRRGDLLLRSTDHGVDVLHRR